MGVRDALRMVDSFIKWARRNEDRAKSLDDFIHDGLVAAAKRCESCLKDDLGLTFGEEQRSHDMLSKTEHVPPGYESSPPDEPKLDEETEEGFELPTQDMTPEPSEVSIESESDSISIDSVGRLEEEAFQEISIDGPPREFSSDFELIEPTDLVVDKTETSKGDIPSSESTIGDESPEDADRKPSFTWADYEKAITPIKEDQAPTDEDEDIELPPPVDIGAIESTSDIPPTPEPPEPHVENAEMESGDEEEPDTSETTEPITEPPPPPPPPESDEDEEERRRRARRLFFGD